jgi:hypothetical protein
MRESPEAVILSAAKDLRAADERSFAALRMTAPTLPTPFLINLPVKDRVGAGLASTLVPVLSQMVCGSVDVNVNVASR